MNEKIRETDFNTLDDDSVNLLIDELIVLGDAELKETLEVLIDEKVDLDLDIPTSLQKIFNNEKISSALLNIETETETDNN